MVDKPIIINGVDVGGCEYLGLYKEYKLKCGSCYPVDCSDNPNCYYKQLIRKENECEKAKQNAQDTYDLWQALIESFNILQDEKIKLEQECEELKKQIEVIKERLFRKIAPIDYTDCPYYIKMVKLKQILTEIKGIAEGRNNYPCSKCIKTEILQKISECEVDNA